jgi:hypothetical protein
VKGKICNIESEVNMSNSKIKVHFTANRNCQHQHATEGAKFVRLQPATLHSETQNSSAKGWGSCSKCPCAGFVQSYGSDICGRCGHSYYEHW